MASETSIRIKQEPLDSTVSNDNQPGCNTVEAIAYLTTCHKDLSHQEDTDAAASCLLAMKLLSHEPNLAHNNDQKVSTAHPTGPIRHIANVIRNLFQFNQTSTKEIPGNVETMIEKSNITSSTIPVQQVDDNKILLNELKYHHLRLKSTRIQTSANVSCSRATLLPRISLSDRPSELENLDSPRHKSICQLFDSLPEKLRRMFIDQSLRTCEEALEHCEIMLLSFVFFEDYVKQYGSKLLRTLIDLSDQLKASRDDEPNARVTELVASSMLVLDAIPAVLAKSSLSDLEFCFEELSYRILDFYELNCIRPVSIECRKSELQSHVKRHFGMKHENDSPVDNSIDGCTMKSLNLVCDSFIASITDENLSNKFNTMRKFLANSEPKLKLSDVTDPLYNLSRESLPEDVLFSNSVEESASSQKSSSSQPRSRGRPKKPQASVIVNPGDAEKCDLVVKSREANFTFITLIQYFFSNCFNYLKGTKSRVLVCLDQTMTNHLSRILRESPTLGKFRRKRELSIQEQRDTKRIKVLDGRPINPDSLNKTSDLDIGNFNRLVESKHCLEFIRGQDGVFRQLWNRHCLTFEESYWFNRMMTDHSMLSLCHEDRSAVIENRIGTPCDENDSVAHLRLILQLLNTNMCQEMDLDMENFRTTIDNIVKMTKIIKDLGLLSCEDENFWSSTTEPELVTLGEYHQRPIGFLYFDSFSMFRYMVNSLLAILQQYVDCEATCSDKIVGNVIILCQLDWPENFRLYSRCIKWIRSTKPKSTTPQCLSSNTKFTYPEFFEYIHNANIIEDFVALLSQGYTLDIRNSTSAQIRSATQNQPVGGGRGTTGASTRSAKVIQTRGVNKTFKEDLKVALVAQIKKSSVQVQPSLIAEFIINRLAVDLKALID